MSAEQQPWRFPNRMQPMMSDTVTPSIWSGQKLIWKLQKRQIDATPPCWIIKWMLFLSFGITKQYGFRETEFNTSDSTRRVLKVLFVCVLLNVEKLEQHHWEQIKYRPLIVWSMKLVISKCKI